MSQHREVSSKDLGLSEEDQELMRLGDVYRDPDEKKNPVAPENDDIQFAGDVYRDPPRSREISKDSDDSESLDAPGNHSAREGDSDSDEPEE